MEIVYSNTAKTDLKFWKASGNVQIQSRISQVIQAILNDPFNGIGKPEPLKHNFSGAWSRRINREHRMVYVVTNNIITIISLRHHY